MSILEPQSRPDVDICPACADSGKTIPVHAHTRDGDEFEHRCPICRHEWTVTRTPQELKPPRSAEKLDLARTSLSLAKLAAGSWHRGPSNEEENRNYVRAGHDAVARIDETLRALYDARGALVTELHRDEDLSALRVDALLTARPTPDGGQ